MTDLTLTSELQAICGRFERPSSADGSLTFDKTAREGLLEILRTLRDMSRAMETELRGFRSLEGDRVRRRFLEREASAMMRDAVEAIDGNVFRPDFGRRT